MSKLIYTKSILIVFLILNSLVSNGQTVWEWAEGSSESASDELLVDMKTDSQGNVYITGHFYSSQITFGANTLNNLGGDNGTADIFLVKYNTLGELQWAYNYGSDLEDEVKKLAVDNNNQIIMVGSFSASQISIGSETLIQNAGTGRNMYVAKLDADANVLWADNYGDINDSGVSGASIDDDNNVYLVGFFNGASLTLGSQIINNSSSSVSYDIFIAKLSTDGTPIWGDNIEGADGQTEFAHNLTTDSQGNIIVHGDFWGETSVLSCGSINLIGDDAINYFIAKYDTDGTALWAKKGDSNDNTCETRGRASVITDNNDNIYAHIYFKGDDYNFGTYTLTSTCNGDENNSFILKLDANGNELWYEHFNSFTWGNAMESTWSGLTISPENELIVASTFNESELLIDNITITNSTTLTGAYTPFFVKFNQSGEAIWGETTVNNYHAGAVAIEADSNGDIIIAGSHIIGSMFFDAYEVQNNGAWDVFVAKKSGIPTSAPLVNNLSDINIFPNPSNGILNISGNEINKIELLNLQAQAIESFLPKESNTQINIKTYPKGVYFVKIYTKGIIETRKIIIQ